MLGINHEDTLLLHLRYTTAEASLAIIIVLMERIWARCVSILDKASVDFHLTDYSVCRISQEHQAHSTATPGHCGKEGQFCI